MAEPADIFAAMETGRVVPVLTIGAIEPGIALARALVAGGLRVLEITLRTPTALDAIRAIAEACPDAIVGAGTVLESAQFDAAAKAGARFLVSPGASERMTAAARAYPLPWLPGATSPSEVIRLREQGYTRLKFFPAAQYGGVAWLKAVAPLFPDTRFCPTGGVTPGNAADYLSQPNVFCVGGSWVAPADAVKNGQWDTVTALAQAAAGLAKPAIAGLEKPAA